MTFPDGYLALLARASISVGKLWDARLVLHGQMLSSIVTGFVPATSVYVRSVSTSDVLKRRAWVIYIPRCLVASLGCR